MTAKQRAAMSRSKKLCQFCGVNRADWYMQYVGSDAPTYCIPGWHYRGFPTTPICDECKQQIERAEARHERLAA